MKVKVVQRFRDKDTGNIRKVGSVFEATPERAEELRDYVEPVKEKEPKGA